MVPLEVLSLLPFKLLKNPFMEATMIATSTVRFTNIRYTYGVRCQGECQKMNDDVDWVSLRHDAVVNRRLKFFSNHKILNESSPSTNLGHHRCDHKHMSNLLASASLLG
jgi:hypothetical protein